MSGLAPAIAHEVSRIPSHKVDGVATDDSIDPTLGDINKVIISGRHTIPKEDSPLVEIGNVGSPGHAYSQISPPPAQTPNPVSRWQSQPVGIVGDPVPGSQIPFVSDSQKVGNQPDGVVIILN